MPRQLKGRLERGEISEVSYLTDMIRMYGYTPAYGKALQIALSFENIYWVSRLAQFA